MPIQFSLPGFLRPSRPNPAAPVRNQVDVRPLPSPKTGLRLGPPDRLTILSQWRRLGTLDQKSHDYLELLKRLIDIKENRTLALEFTDDDAGIVINIIDKAGPLHRL